MSRQHQEVIQIDDSHSRSQEHPQEPAPQSNNNISLNFNPQVFPKLYSMLSKKQEIKQRAHPPPPPVQTPKPQLIPMVLDQSETIQVSTIIKILPDPIKPKASQIEQQGETLIKTDYCLKDAAQNNRDILIVQQNIQPLIEPPKVEQPLKIDAEVHECPQNVQHQHYKKQDQIVVHHVQSMVLQSVPNISTQHQGNPQPQQIQLPESISDNPQIQHIEIEIDNNHNKVCSNIISSHAQEHHMDIEEPIRPQNTNQTVNKGVFINQEGENQVVPSHGSVGSISHENIHVLQEEDNAQPEPTYEQVAQMKRKVSELFPELAISILYMSTQEITDLYNTTLHQRSPATNQEPSLHNQTQVLQSQRYKNDQSMTNPLQHNSINQQSTLIHEPEKQNIHVSQSYKNLEAMASLGQEQLRNNMIMNYPQAKDSLLQMNHQELRTLLSEVLVQIKKKQISNKNQQARQSQTNLPTQTPGQGHADQPTITKDDMIKILTTISPHFKFLIEKMDQSYLKDLYIQSLQLNLASQAQRNNSIVKKIIYDGKISHSFIMQLCAEKFPHLQTEVQELTEDQIKDIYEDMSSHEGPWNIPLLLQKYKIHSNNHESNLNSSSQIQKSLRTEQHNSENENPLARSHSMMQNPEISDSKPLQSQLQIKQCQNKILKIKIPNMEGNAEQIDAFSKKTQQAKGQKKKGLRNIPPGELRAKLIAKLPELKDNIMRLDDKEIQKIFRESMENSKAQSANHAKKLRYDEELKPVIIIPDKKYRPELEKQLQQKNKEALIDNEKTKVYEIKDSSKKKRVRTMVVIHTEEIDDSIQNGYKMKRTDNGVEKKVAGYESASKLQIGDILRLLTQAIERRDE